MGNINICLVEKCPMNSVVSKEGKSTIRSKTRMSARGIMSKKAEKLFMSDCKRKGIKLTKFYEMDQDFESFYQNYPKNPILDDLKSRYKDQVAIKEGVCGFHKYFKIKYDDFNEVLESFGKLESMTSSSRKSFLEELSNFIECFYSEDYINMFSLFNNLSKTMNKSAHLKISGLDNSKIQDLTLFFKIALSFIYKHNINRALSDFPEDNSKNNFSLKNEIKKTNKEFYENFLAVFIESNLKDFSDCVEEIKPETKEDSHQENELQFKLNNQILTKEPHIKLSIGFLKVLIHQINDIHKDLISEDQNLQLMTLELFHLTSKLFWIVKPHKSKQSLEIRLQKCRQDFIFYSIGVVSSYCSIVSEPIEDLKDMNKTFLIGLLENSERLSLEIIEASIIYEFTNFKDEIIQGFKALPQYRKVMVVLEKGIDIDYNLFSDDLNPSALKDFLIKIEDEWLSIVDEGVEMLINNARDFFEV